MSRDHHSLFNNDARFVFQPATNTSPAVLQGYAVVYNALSSDRGGYKVRFMAGSVSTTPVVRALYHHSYAHPLGRTDKGTLRLSSDSVGVRVEIDLPDTTYAKDLSNLIKRGDVQGMSFGVAFWPPVGKETLEDVGGVKTTVFSVSSCVIDEVTVTGNPAFAESSIAHKPNDEGEADKLASARRADQARFESLRLSGLHY